MGIAEQKPPGKTGTGQAVITADVVAMQIASQAADDEEVLAQLDTYTLPQLKSHLRARGLPVSGKKALLRHHLSNYLLQQDLPFEDTGMIAGPSKRKVETIDLDSEPGIEAPALKKVAAGLLERRRKPWRALPSKNVLDRLTRALSQRFFLIERKREGQALLEEFKVLGSTGNVYTVTVDETPRCSCPDGYRGNLCKHLIFVIIRVLRVPQTSALWYQAALLKSELAEIFNNAPAAPNDANSERVKLAYQKAMGTVSVEVPKTDNEEKKKKLDDGTDCAVCYEEMKREENLWFCETCSNALHTQCFDEWKTAARNTGKSITCPTCRSEFKEGLPQGAKMGGAGRTINGYLNLADEVGIDRGRDVSTYYMGPRRGMTRWEAAAFADRYEYEYDF